MVRKTIAVTLNYLKVRWILIGIVVLLAAADEVIKIAHWKFGIQSGLEYRMSIGGEMSLPTWYASLQLSAAGAILAYIAWRKLRTHDRHIVSWFILSAGFFLMSLDESIMLHEKWARVLPAGAPREGIFSARWVVVAIPLCLILLAYFWRLLASVSTRTRVGWIVSGGIFVASAVGMEMVGAYGLSTGLLHKPGFAYETLNMIENGGELLGIALFIPELIRYMDKEMEWAGA